MINIAYLVSSLKGCGPVTILYNIVKYLDKEKFNVFIITLSSVSENSVEKDFEELGCKVINLNFRRLEWRLKALHEMENLIKQNEIHIIHGHGIRPDYIISKFSHDPSVKTCSTLHNYPFMDYRMTYGKVKGYLMAIFHLSYLKNIDYSCTCSKSVSDLLMLNNDLSIDYIRNGVDQEKYYLVNYQKKRELREKLRLPINKKIYISVGHLNSRKDPLTIIKYFKDNPDSMIVFLGDGELYNECISLCGNCENMKFIGFVPNVIDYLQASDYFISASKAEGLPNTVMEAMACGLPVILSNIEPHIEIINFNEKSGVLFHVGNEKDLRLKLQYLENESYEDVSENASNVVKNFLNAEIMSNEYKNIYMKLFSERERGKKK